MLILECLTFFYILLNFWIVFAVQKFQLQGFAGALLPLPQSSVRIILGGIFHLLFVFLF